jgi:hypothetical protein
MELDSQTKRDEFDEGEGSQGDILKEVRFRCGIVGHVRRDHLYLDPGWIVELDLECWDGGLKELEQVHIPLTTSGAQLDNHLLDDTPFVRLRVECQDDALEAAAYQSVSVEANVFHRVVGEFAPSIARGFCWSTAIP